MEKYNRIFREAKDENKILEVLSSHKFESWYEKDFLDYVQGEVDAKSKEEILKDIKSIFK